jgi:hypothetical protein
MGNRRNTTPEDRDNDRIPGASCSTEEAEEFKQMYFEEYGIKLTTYEATKKATKLINLIRVIFRPIPDAHNNGHKKPDPGRWF